MFHELHVAAVVPAYMEEQHIASVIATMPAIVDHIVIVDDASPDETAARAREAADERDGRPQPAQQPGCRRSDPGRPSSRAGPRGRCLRGHGG